MIKTEVQTVARGSFEPPAPTLKKHKQKWKRREELCATLMASLPFIGFLLFTIESTSNLINVLKSLSSCNVNVKSEPVKIIYTRKHDI